MNNRLKDKIVVITGGTSGIGLSLVKVFASSSSKVFILARQQSKLDETVKMLQDSYGADLRVKTFCLDVGIDKEEVLNVINSIGNEYHGIDILINNAGIMRCGYFSDLNINDFEQSLQSNYLSALYCTRAAWKFLAIKKGSVGFVSSVAGYIGLTGYTAYAPSKFAMTALAECLRMEGKNDGIGVSVIYPGDTNTPLLEYEHQHAPPETMEINKGVKVKQPDEVAARLVDGILANKYEIYCDASSNFYRKLKGAFPGVFYKSIDAIARRARK